MNNIINKTCSAGGVVINPKGDILLVSLRGGKYWGFPKGRVEGAEEIIEAARREVYEETGISDLELVQELPTYERYPFTSEGKLDTSKIKTLCMFVFKVSDTAVLKPVDPEISEARWCSKDDVVKMLSHSKDKEFFVSIKDII